LNINELYQIACNGGKTEEDRLFNKIRESFFYLVEQRIQNSQDTEDIVQDIIITVSEKYRGITFEKSFSAWIYQIMEYKLLHYYRGKYKQSGKNISTDVMEKAYHYINPDPDLTRRLLSCLKKINSVNNRYARILNLGYLGYTTAEICQKMAITRNNAFTIISRARSLLKYCLKNGEVN